MWVSSAPAVDVADRVQPRHARDLQRVVDLEAPAGLQAHGVQADVVGCARRGRWRPAPRRRAARRASRSSTTSSPSRRAALTSCPSRTSTPARPQRLVDRLRRRPAPGRAAAGRRAGAGSPGSRAPARRWPSRSRPRRRRAPAAGRAPPWRWSPRAWSTARRRPARRPAGRRPRDPVHTATACRAVSSTWCRRRLVDHDASLAASRPCPRTSSMPAPCDPLDLAVVVPVRGEVVAAGEHRGDVQLAGDRLRRPGDRAGLGEHLACRAAAPCSACTPSTSTRRRPARSPRARRSARPGRRCRRRSPRPSPRRSR